MKWWTEIISVASKDPLAFGAFLVLVVWSLARSWFRNAHPGVRTAIFLVLLAVVYLVGDRFVQGDRLVHLAPSRVLDVELPAQTRDADDFARQIDANLPLFLRQRKFIALPSRSVEDACRAAGVAGVAFTFLISKPTNATAYARIIPLVQASHWRVTNQMSLRSVGVITEMHNSGVLSVLLAASPRGTPIQ